MKSLRYSIIANFIFQKHKRDVAIIFSVIKNIKKINKTKNFKRHIASYENFSESKQKTL